MGGAEARDQEVFRRVEELPVQALQGMDVHEIRSEVGEESCVAGLARRHVKTLGASHTERQRNRKRVDDLVQVESVSGAPLPDERAATQGVVPGVEQSHLVPLIP